MQKQEKVGTFQQWLTIKHSHHIVKLSFMLIVGHREKENEK